MNLSNKLTVSRIFLTFVLMYFLFARWAGAKYFAFFTFLTACLTDYLDGYFARKEGMVTDFGKLMDPIADKILVLGALIALIEKRELDIPTWGVFLIVARDLLLGGVRTLAAVQGKVMAAEQWGKWKMGIQSGAVLLMLAILVARENVAGAPAWLARLPYHLTVLCVALTWASAYFYYRQSRRMIESSWG